MSLQEKRAGTAREKGNSWIRGKGLYSFRGELKHGIKLNKRKLNRSIRHNGMEMPNHSAYKKVIKTKYIVDFS